MNNNKVFIVKMKWIEKSHYSRVKRVFYNEKNSMDFIDSEKVKDKNKGAFWIISDREISDYEPCLTDTDLELAQIDSLQSFIEIIISASLSDKFDLSIFLEENWAMCEERRIKIDP